MECIKVPEWHTNSDCMVQSGAKYKFIINQLYGVGGGEGGY